MLPKKNRLDTKTVEKVFKIGSFFTSPSLTLRFLKGKEGLQPRISVVVPKSVAKKATERNLLRRRGYLALGGILDTFPTGFTGVLVFKKTIPLLEIKNETKTLIAKIN
jgi:ribonuclease P protein component